MRSTWHTPLPVLYALCGLACGGGAADPSPPGGKALPCNADHCGAPAFRAAVPTRAQLRIPFGRARTQGGLSASRRSLEAISPAYAELEAYVGEINDDIELIFTELESLASTAPEAETEAEHQWREVDEGSGLEEVLELETADQRSFALRWSVGPAGFEPNAEDAIVEATIDLDADSEVVGYGIEVNLGQWTLADPALLAAGTVRISAEPYQGGELELWYDYDNVTVGGETAVSSETTFYRINADEGALEYLDVDSQGEAATAYARFGAAGGRLDHHLNFQDEGEPLVELASNCWSPSAAETFDAVAWLTAEEEVIEAELDGEEGNCAYGPIADHPEPGPELSLLPESGAWDQLILAQQAWCDAHPEECP